MASKGVKLASAQSSTIFAQSLIKMQFLPTHEPQFHTMKSVCQFSTMVKVPGGVFLMDYFMKTQLRDHTITGPLQDERWKVA